VEHAVETVDAAFRRFCREVEVLVVRFGPEDPLHSADKAVEQDDALGIGCLFGVVL